MSQSDDLEVDADELSAEVREELVANGTYDPDEADEVAKRVWVEEKIDREAERTGIGRILVSAFLSAVSFVFGVFRLVVCRLQWLVKTCVGAAAKTRSVFIILLVVGGYVAYETAAKTRSVFSRRSVVVVTDVSVDKGKERVLLDVEHQWRSISDTVKLGVDSTALSNLLVYTGVDNPLDLAGEELVVDFASVMTSEQFRVVIPHNLSFAGRLRFRLFAAAGNVLSKLVNRRPVEQAGAFLVVSWIVGFVCYVAALAPLSPYETAAEVPMLNAIIGYSLLSVTGLVIAFTAIVVTYVMFSATFYIVYNRVLRGNFMTQTAGLLPETPR